MRYFNIYKKHIAILIVIASLLISVKLPAFAATEVYESEYNDTMATANTTYDGYAARGALTTTSDIDYWKYTATFTGFANIRMGSVPSGTNYDLFLFNSAGTYMTCSVKTGTSQEIMKCRLREGSTYYVKVVSASGCSSSKYKLSIKNYELGTARLFAYEGCSDLDTTQFAEESLPYFSQYKYSGYWYLNNSVSAAYDVLPSSRVFIINNHAEPGVFYFDSTSTNRTYLFANQISDMSSSDRALANIGDLSNVALIIFGGCESGVSDTTNGNLVNMAISKGAQCAIGWQNEITSPTSDCWIVQFVYNSGLDKNITNASTAADANIYETRKREYYNLIINRETGTSRPTSIVI